ncbi:MAG: tripartite tricarboxylate transporter substrate binding protein [Burkholderiales bacterium]|nr:tripartite tricarboxylate transporter substrate binding protein [Burkholderiales bacterium]MCE7875833.1 tripartite tricarboxylate transporter substrate binding protein [Betaproteobacteria bacterium PRO3]
MKCLIRAVALTLAITAGAASAAYPERPITFVVPWGAGGGTDTTARYFAAGLEKELGQPVNVVNRTGGSGVVGHSAIATAPADGYTIGMITVEITMMHWQGLTDLSPTSYTPLALVNADPAGFTVGANSPFKSVKEVLDYAKANPGKLKASGTGQGGIWHLALAGLMNDTKIPQSAIPWVPSNGAAPAMQDLAAGGVDIVTCSLPEARALIDAGKAKPLAVMDSKPSALFPNVPTMKVAAGSNWTVSAWRGIAAPKGLPADVQQKLIAAIKKIWDSKEFKDFASSKGYGMEWAPGAEFASFMAKGDADMGVVMKAAGIVK